jgi:hypothetical protein
MVKGSRGKTRKRGKRAGMNRAIAADTEVEDMYAFIQEKVRGQLDRLPYGKVTSKVADKMVDNIFSGKPETGGFHEVKKAKILQRKVNDVLYDLHQMKQEVKNRLKPYVKMKKEERKEKVGVTKAKQSLNISKKKGSKGKIDGITDLAPDLADMITQRLRKTKVPDDVLRRIDQGQTKKKRSKKRRKKTRKKRRRSKRY